MGKTKRLSCIAMLIIFSLLCCGAGLAKNDPKLNIDDTPVYEIVTVEGILDKAAVNFDGASGIYNGHAVAFQGTTLNVNVSEKSFEVASGSDSSKRILVKTKDNNSIKTLSVNQNTVVYGVIKFRNGSIEVTADMIVAGGELEDSKDYCFRNRRDKYVEVSDLTSRSIAEGTVRYYIPKSWQGCELTGEDKAAVLGVVPENGEAYYLNSLKGKSEPEFFCIFYFDNDEYVAYDTDKSETLAIERAIITNICPDEESKLKWNSLTLGHYSYFTEGSKTAFGLKFNYYAANYDSHRVEFVFTPAEGGVCVMMYVYNKDYSSLEDVLTIMRTLSVKGGNR